MPGLLSATTTPFPDFPTDISTHPLLVIDYALLEAGDEAEIERLWDAARNLGFWYLKNHGTTPLVESMFAMARTTLALPMSEKLDFEQGDAGNSFGYKSAGANAVDASGVPDTVEFINIAKDDALAFPRIARRAYPGPVNDRMGDTIRPFVERAMAVNGLLLRIFDAKLGLPVGTLARMHPVEEHSGSEARVIKNPPAPDWKRVAIGAHTDFGSLSFLHNRLGGLQVLVPGADPENGGWQYVKPLEGCAICNIGDSLALFSGGILRSNMHRVLPAPSTQSTQTRWSLVFFTRPGNSVILRALVEDSPIIAAAVAQAEDKNKFDTGCTSLEWFTRRIKNQRMANRVGPETWMNSRGTEHQPAA
ncbi:unnamed protein product [Mycena citricolor]|uniref:Fe2OG dioxygenase domain-containing protein n=1 Tax=Mycena citricolor TaxID=2018698 RepID=A0AAD2K2U4_9AGAR|nr:unnamed protein product [Mycena citricolor]CAK5276281.1 unnamed protein product [Mycena citricolor]